LTPLAVREWGERAAPPLVYWPGLNAVAHVHLADAAPALAARSRSRVLAIAPPGWGSPPLAADEYRPTALSARIVALLDARALGRVVFVGWSWGATIGCHLAALAPERLRALILLDAGYTDFQDRPNYVERTLAESTATLRAQTPCFSTWDEVPERARAAFVERDGAIVPVVAPEVIAAAAHGVAAEPPSATLAALGRLEPPILLVTAAETVAQEWARRALRRFRSAVPDATVVEIASGHDLLSDAPDETIAAISDWLSPLSLGR